MAYQQNYKFDKDKKQITLVANGSRNNSNVTERISNDVIMLNQTKSSQVFGNKLYSISDSGLYSDSTLMEYGLSVLNSSTGSVNFYNCLQKGKRSSTNTTNHYYSPKWFGDIKKVATSIDKIPAAVYNSMILNNIGVISINGVSAPQRKIIGYDGKTYSYLSNEELFKRKNNTSQTIDTAGFYLGYGIVVNKKPKTSKYYALVSIVEAVLDVNNYYQRSGISETYSSKGEIPIRMIVLHTQGTSSYFYSSIPDSKFIKGKGYDFANDTNKVGANIISSKHSSVKTTTYLIKASNNPNVKNSDMGVWGTKKGRYYDAIEWNKTTDILDFIKANIDMSTDSIETGDSPNSSGISSAVEEEQKSYGGNYSYDTASYIQEFGLLSVNWAECIDSSGNAIDIGTIRKNVKKNSNCAFAAQIPKEIQTIIDKKSNDSISSTGEQALFTKEAENNVAPIDVGKMIDSLYTKIENQNGKLCVRYTNVGSIFLKNTDVYYLDEICIPSITEFDTTKVYTSSELANLIQNKKNFSDYIYNATYGSTNGTKLCYFVYNDIKNGYMYKKETTSFASFIDEVNKGLQYSNKTGITFDFSVEQQSKDIKLYSFELFEAYSRGRDFISYDYTQVRPEEQDSDGKRLMSKDDNYFSYKYSGREFDIMNYKKDISGGQIPKICNNKMPIAMIHSKDLIQENDITLGDTYAYNRYFIEAIQYKDKDNGQLKYKDTFIIKDFVKALDDTQYTEDDYKIITANIDLTQCEYYHPSKAKASNRWCDCSYGSEDGSCKTECLYQKSGFCPYRFNTEKHPRRIRTLKQEKSNRFNLIQETSKVFEFYPYFYIEYDKNGKVLTYPDGKMKKHVCFLTEKGNKQEMGFRYEKNLDSITRTVDSESLTTRLFVENVDTELSNTGLCSIESAEDNIGKNSYLLNFSYYTQMGMLDEDKVKRDLYGIEKGDFAFLPTIGYYNTQYDNLSNLIINMTGEQMTSLEAENTVNITSIGTALEQRQKVAKTMYQFKVRYSFKGKDSYTKSDSYTNYLVKYREQATTLYSNIETLFFSDDKFCYPVDLGNEENDYEPTWKIIDLSSDSNYGFLKNSYCNGEIFWRLFITGWKEEDIPNTLVNQKDFLLNYKPLYPTWEDFKTKVVQKYYYPTCGRLGQYKGMKEQVAQWTKQKARYLTKINELTTQFYQKYESYIKEGTWTDSNYLTDNEYYWAAESVLQDSCKPQITYDIKVKDISPIPEYSDDYNFELADTTFIEDIDFFGIDKHSGLPNKQKVLLTGIEYHLDTPQDNSISVQNYSTSFDELFEQITASVQSLTFNENTYKRASNFTSLQAIDTDSLQGGLDEGQLTLIDSNDKNILLNEEGVKGSDITSSASQYKLTGEGLFFSKDGGTTWNIGVGPKGINADYINCGQLDASKIQIMDNNYIYFLWDKNGITAYRNPSTSTQGLKDFTRFNKYGLSLIENGNVRLRTGYEFKTNERTEDGYNASGDYTDEQELTNQNIGFYLYNDKGVPIFKTETRSSYNDSSADYSARLSLQGEIYATNDVLASEDNGSSLIATTVFKGNGGYIIDTKTVNVIGSAIELTEPVEEQNGEYYIKESGSVIVNKVNKIYYTGDKTNITYYYLINDVFHSILRDEQIKVLRYKDESATSGNLNNTSPIDVEFYDFSSGINTQLPIHLSLYKTNGTSNGINFNYWGAINETSSSTSAITSGFTTTKTGVFINNKKVNTSSNYESTDTEDQSIAASYGTGASERMFTACSLATDEDGKNEVRNIITVLKNGYCYLGGKITDQTGESLSFLKNLDYLPDTVQIKQPAFFVGNNGYVFMDYRHTYGISYDNKSAVNEYSLEERLASGSGGATDSVSLKSGNYLLDPCLDGHYYYHPLGNNAVAPKNSNDRDMFAPHTYQGHGPGKLDLSAAVTPFYAMESGEVIRCGQDNSSSYHSIQVQSEHEKLGTIIFRYYHVFPADGIQVGSKVTQGQLLGTTGNDLNSNGTGDHLHIDCAKDMNGTYVKVGDIVNKEYTVNQSLIDGWKQVDSSRGQTDAYNHYIFAQPIVSRTASTIGDYNKFLGKTIKTNTYSTQGYTIGGESLEITETIVSLANIYAKEELNTACVAGILANNITELGTNFESGYSKYVKNAPVNGNGGLMMWTPYTNHTNWCSVNGYSGKDKTDEANVEHLIDTLRTGSWNNGISTLKKANDPEKHFVAVSSYEEFKQISDPELAAIMFERNFEVSGDWYAYSATEKTNYTPAHKYDRRRRLFATALYNLFTS